MVEVSLFSTWLTPTSLFILLNIVIATILFVSSTTTNHPSHGGADPSPPPLPPHPQPHLARSPSFLSRVMSFNFSYGPEPDPEPQHLLSRSVQPGPARPEVVARAPSFLSRVVSFNSSGRHQSGPTRPEPDLPSSPTVRADPARPAEAVRAPSLLSRVASFSLQGLSRGAQPQQAAGEEEKEARESRDGSRGVEKTKKKKKKQEGVAKSGGGGGGTTSLRGTDEEVDAKAADFINRFNQQLKMQRLESLLGYRNSI